MYFNFQKFSNTYLKCLYLIFHELKDTFFYILRCNINIFHFRQMLDLIWCNFLTLVHLFFKCIIFLFQVVLKLCIRYVFLSLSMLHCLDILKIYHFTTKSNVDNFHTRLDQLNAENVNFPNFLALSNNLVSNISKS